MRPAPVSLLAGLLVGCAASATSPNTADFGGAWHYVESLGAVSRSVSCADTGVYRLTQAGTMFDGDYAQSGVCRTPGGLRDNTDSGFVTRGQVTGQTLRFTVDAVCEYDGRLDPMAGRISGRVVCALSGTDTLTLTGTWSATR